MNFWRGILAVGGLLVLGLALASCSMVVPYGPSPFSDGKSGGGWSQEGWSLVWEEEFSGTALDAAAWTVETGTGPNGDGWGNNELQFYRNENISFLDQAGIKALRITAKKENYSGSAYTSARIKTQNKKFFGNGRVEARMRLPKGQGIWPAFWMLGESIGTVGWPACGEIDIMEMVGGTTAGKSDATVHGTIHWSNSGNSWQHEGGASTLSSGTFNDGWHTFGIERDTYGIRWYVDGQLYHEESLQPADRSELKGNFFILLNLAVGGNWPGPPDGSTQFPQYFDVDWVRVWQRP